MSRFKEKSTLLTTYALFIFIVGGTPSNAQDQSFFRADQVTTSQRLGAISIGDIPDHSNDGCIRALKYLDEHTTETNLKAEICFQLAQFEMTYEPPKNVVDGTRIVVTEAMKANRKKQLLRAETAFTSASLLASDFDLQMRADGELASVQIQLDRHRKTIAKTLWESLLSAKAHDVPANPTQVVDDEKLHTSPPNGLPSMALKELERREIEARYIADKAVWQKVRERHEAQIKLNARVRSRDGLERILCDLYKTYPDDIAEMQKMGDSIIPDKDYVAGLVKRAQAGYDARMAELGPNWKPPVVLGTPKPGQERYWGPKAYQTQNR